MTPQIAANIPMWYYTVAVSISSISRWYYWIIFSRALSLFIIPTRLRIHGVISIVNNHSAGTTSKTTLIQRQHSDTGNRNLSITLIEALAEAVGIDPVEKTLHLNDYLDLTHLDRAYLDHRDDEICVNTVFEYGGYTVEVCCCGSVTISTDVVAWQDEEIELPTSMHSVV